MSVSESLTNLKGVGAALEKKLQKLHISSLMDLLFHLPRSYQDRTQLVPFNQLRLNQQALVEGEVVTAEIKQGRRRMLLVHLSDGQALLVLRFFHFSMGQYRQFKSGMIVRCFGEVKFNQYQKEIIHPEYHLFSPGAVPPVEPSLTPIYPLTDGLTHMRIRALVEQAFSRINARQLKELLPEAIREKFHFTSLFEALEFVHHPPKEVNVNELMEGRHPMQQRLAFEELLAHRLSMLKIRQTRQQVLSVPLLSEGHLQAQLLSQLPFGLTGAQKRVIQEIGQDLSQRSSMMRLLQGDVGSGKTLVALMSALHAIECGKQVAVMAPTEILAEQHYLNFSNLVKPLGIKLEWLVGKLTPKQKREAVARCASGEAQLVVGTHAIFSEKVAFKDLALIIIDEQHRFGVEQRMALQAKGKKGETVPHQLVMTATPIPRTLAMTAYADLDVSVIDELPPGRTPVKTVLISDTRREEVIDRIKASVEAGRQAYWVCTLIEESESLTCEAAEATYEKLIDMLHPLSIGLVHGRMKASEKQAIMAAFKAGEIDVLVATTVIEVGVDVPNSSLMIIENAERLGLAQLHQLRGRVGRGSAESFCVLMYHSPISQISQQRLKVMRETTDGFEISEKDLEIRGPGEMLGTKQTGEVEFKLADILRDRGLLPSVKETAETILTQDPELARELMSRWVGDKEKYILG